MKDLMKVEETERCAAIRAELYRLGVAQIDLAFDAVQSRIYRAQDGRLMARVGDIPMSQFLEAFVNADPEFGPARAEECDPG